MSTKLPWVLSEWHNISASSAPIKMNGVLFQDIKSVIDIILKYPEVQEWSKSVNDVFLHLADTNNPHRVTVDQLPTKIIEVIYSTWRTEGYQGTLQEFIDIFFIYLQIVQYAEMIEHLDSETLVPSVKAVYDYITEHDQSLDVHEEWLKKVFKGFVPNTQPGTSFFQYIGFTDEDLKFFDPTVKQFMNYPAFDGVVHPRTTMTLVGAMRFIKPMLCFGIHSATTKEQYFVYIDPPSSTVQLKKSELDGSINILASIDMTPLMSSVLDPDRHLAVAIVFDGYKVKLAVDMSVKDYTLPNLTTVVATIPIQKTPRGPINPRLMFARMDQGDPMQSIVVYRQAMDDDQLAFLFAGYQYPIIQSSTNIARDDKFEMIQDSQLTIMDTQLYSNDFFGDGTPVPITAIEYHTPFRGSISPGVGKVVFKSTGKAGDKAGFKYTTFNKNGIISTADVDITVLPLREIDVHIFTKTELDQWLTTFVVPSMADVFNSWARFSDVNAYYPPGVTPEGEATKWSMIDASNFACQINSVLPTGMISPNVYDRYTLEATLSSTNTDDDEIGLVIAFKRINGVNHYLWTSRNCTGGGSSHTEFLLRYTTYDIVSEPPVWKTSNLVTSNHESIWSGNLSTNIGSGWNVNSPNRLRVERTPTGVICSCSPWKSTDLSKGVSISLNFDDYPQLDFCKTLTPYGFICNSQNLSKWTDVVFNGGDRKDDEAYDYENNAVYRYSGNTWVKTKLTIQQALGYPRIVKSATTGKRFQVLENSILVLS